MMVLRPCYRSDVSLNDMLAEKQDEQQREENERAMAEAMERAKEYAVLNR